MNGIQFEVIFGSKKICFTTSTNGIIVDGVEYLANEDSILIYDKTASINNDQVLCQFSSNTSTLIPALRILGIRYNSYFDRRAVVESQNDIQFYWSPSRLAAFYNRYSTDGVAMDKRESIIRSAVDFLIHSKDTGEKLLPEEKLKKLDEECKLLGFYRGFPIFDAAYGLPQLKSNLGIYMGNESIMISTPVDTFEKFVFDLAQYIQGKTGIKGLRKKNRVRFEKNGKIIGELNI